jgi:hypothetical protein
MHMMERKLKSLTRHGRYNRIKAGRVPDLSAENTVSPARSWTSINMGQGACQFKDGFLLLNAVQKILAGCSLVSSTPPTLKHAWRVVQGCVWIANATTAHSSRALPLRLGAASYRGLALLYNKLLPKPTTPDRNEDKIAAELPYPNGDPLATGSRN